MVNEYKNYDFIKIAEELINKKGQPLEFKEIWGHICEGQKISKEDADLLVGEFYTTLCMHKKFIFTVNDKKELWSLKKFYSLGEIKEIKKQNNVTSIFSDDIYDYSTDSKEVIKEEKKHIEDTKKELAKTMATEK